MKIKKQKNKKIRTAERVFSIEELKIVFELPNEKNWEYGMLPFYSVILSQYPTLHKYIDTAFEDNQYEIYKVSKESSYYDFYFYKMLDLEHEYYAKRLCGLFLHDISIGQGIHFKKILDLTKAKFYKVAQYIESLESFSIIENHNILVLFFEHFEGLSPTSKPLRMAELSKEASTTSHYHHLSLRSFPNTLFIVGMFLFAGIKGVKPQDISLFFRGGEQIISELKKSLLTDSEFEDYKNKQFLERINDVKENKTELFQHFKDILTNDKKIDTWDPFIKEKRSSNHLFIEDRKISFSDIFKLISFIEIQFNFKVDDIFKGLTKKEFDQYLELFLVHSPFLSENKKAENLYFIFLAFLFKKIAEKNELNKKFFFEKHSIDTSLELEHSKNEIIQLKNVISEQQRKSLNQEKTINNYEKEKEKIVNELTKENNKLRESLRTKDDEIQSLKEELHYFREYTYSLEKINESEFFKEKDEIDSFIPSLQGTNITVIGGHPQWKTKIVKILPNLRFIDSDTHFDEQIVLNSDIVLYHTEHLSHGVFYRVHPIVKGKKVQFGFLRKENIQLSLFEMKHEIEKNNFYLH